MKRATKTEKLKDRNVIPVYRREGDLKIQTQG